MEVVAVSDFDRLMADSLKAIRDEHVAQIEAEIPAARRRIADKLRVRFRVVVGGTALAAAAVAAFVFVSQTVPKIDRATPIKPSGEPVVMRRIDVPGVAEMETGLGSMWVASHKGLVAIEPATGEIGTESPVNAADGMAFDSEAMFAIDSVERTISRIPFGTDESGISTTMEGTPTLITASEEAVWVAAAIGPEGHSQITAYTPHLEVPGGTAATLEGRVVADMVHVDDSLWMSASRATPDEGFELHRFWDGGDEAQVWDLSSAEGNPADVAVGEGAAWVLRHGTPGGGNTITRVALETQDVEERAVSFDDTIEDIAVGEGYLWVTTAPTGMDMPDDTRASLHRIDPATLEPVGEPLDVAGPGSKLAVGYGYVWVGDPNNKQIVQVDPSGESSPSPEESITPAPEQTEDQGPPADPCRSFLPFLSTDGGFALGLGSGGQEGVPLAQQSPRALVHYSDGGPGRYIDVIAGETVWPPFDEERIDVLGTNGFLHRIEDGYAITFGMGGCEFQLLGYGFDEAQIRDFVSGLALRGHSGSFDDSFVMWPEPAPEDAYVGCRQAGPGQDSFRADAAETAREFARQQLRWNEAVIEPAPGDYDMEQGYQAVDVARYPVSSGAPRVRMIMREVAPECWSVSSLGTVLNDSIPRDAPAGMRVGSIDGTTTAMFDLEREAAGQRVASVRLKVGPGSVLLYRDEFEDKGRIELVDAPWNAPTYVLVLLLDAQGEVVGAIGQALPSGDFTAG